MNLLTQFFRFVDSHLDSRHGRGAYRPGGPYGANNAAPAFSAPVRNQNESARAFTRQANAFQQPQHQPVPLPQNNFGQVPYRRDVPYALQQPGSTRPQPAGIGLSQLLHDLRVVRGEVKATVTRSAVEADTLLQGLGANKDLRQAAADGDCGAYLVALARVRSVNHQERSTGNTALMVLAQSPPRRASADAAAFLYLTALRTRDSLGALPDLNLRNLRGDTALMIAVHCGHTAFVDQLLVAALPNRYLTEPGQTLPLDIHARDFEGRTAYDLAQQRGDQHVCNLLREYTRLHASRLREMEVGVAPLEDPTTVGPSASAPRLE